uniref:AAA+ ATPase domain-containing protein n=1 Tax=Tetranychus urticae TaxID=32264 RepID=T1KLR5_TETUR
MSRNNSELPVTLMGESVIIPTLTQLIEETEATKEIDKALKKKARLKERYLFSPSANFEDLGGIDDIVNDLKEYLDPEQRNLVELGYNGCKRILISGVSGVGKIDALDYGFMSAARFTKKVYIDVPDEKSRSSILKVLSKSIKINEDLNFDELGAKTPGYVGSDLRDLVDEAGLVADERLRKNKTRKPNEKSSDLDESMETETNISRNVIDTDFYIALKRIKPSLKRDGFASIPAITWADIGACDHIRKKLMATILLPVKCPAFMEKTMRGKTSCGILLHGPPGCGKTSIAKAIANEGEIAFISVKGPEVLNMYVGESERKIRDIFEKAAKAKPCVIFFDEIDALCTERAASERSNVTQSVLSQILTEMDGFDNQSCLVLAATNRLDVLDSAILRPGRFDNHIYVGVPDEAARLDILKAITRNNKPPLSSEVSLKSIAYDSRLRNFTGADLRGLIERAHTIACIEMYDEIGTLDEEKFVIKPHHIESALKERGASISDEMLEFYLKSAKKVGLS